MENTVPLVSVVCTTYNHESYIRQALDGFVIQQCNFPIEIIIHDDASTDNTVAIIKEYAAKYPFFRATLQKENQYSKGFPIWDYLFTKETQGKYIALCEGDDYWTDPLKLQKQVDFLEANPDYSMCFHNAKIVYESDLKDFYFPFIENRNYSLKELYENWIVPTASIVIRKDALPLNKVMADTRILNGDIFIILSAATKGYVFGMSDTMSVYRIQENGLTLKRSKENNLLLQFRYIEHYNFLKKIFSELPLKTHDEKLTDTYINIGVIYLRKLNFRFAKYLYLGITRSPKRFFKRIFKLLN